MIKNVTVREVYEALVTLNNISQQSAKNRETTIKIGQNLRVLRLEARTLDALRRQEVQENHPYVEPKQLPSGLMQYSVFPEGWDKSPDAENGVELLNKQAELLSKFQTAMTEFDDTKIDVELRGLKLDDLDGFFGLDSKENSAEELNIDAIARIGWLLTDLPED
jgi:hypothetical protein